MYIFLSEYHYLGTRKPNKRIYTAISDWRVQRIFALKKRSVFNEHLVPKPFTSNNNEQTCHDLNIRDSTRIQHSRLKTFSKRSQHSRLKFETQSVLNAISTFETQSVYTNTLIMWQLSDLQEQHQCQLYLQNCYLLGEKRRLHLNSS